MLAALEGFRASTADFSDCLIGRRNRAAGARQTDFTVKLIDVYPPNEDYPDRFALNLTDGILRARYRDSWEEPTLPRQPLA